MNLLVQKLDRTLSEREYGYGSFHGNASATQRMKQVVQQYAHNLSMPQLEALEMIVHKISRILNGDAKKEDSWLDIAGYAIRGAESTGSISNTPEGFTEEDVDSVKFSKTPQGIYKLPKFEYFGKTSKPPTDEQWIPWEGGGCPVEKDVLVDIQHRNGCTFYNIPAGNLYWGHSSMIQYSYLDIISYHIH